MTGTIMTLPDERYRAVVQTRRFLMDLCNSAHTPRVPKIVREHARWCLRHYPSDWEMSQAAEAAPHVFAEKMEPLHRLLLQYEQETNKELP